MDNDFDKFKKQISPLIGLDLFQYKSKQMERRILSFMTRAKLNTFDEFYQQLKADKDLLNKFVNMLTINVSEFFRDQNRFEDLEKIYLPEIKKHTRGKIKLWSAGCSIGAEVYTVAMILDQNNMLAECTLHASDFDTTILEKAKSGIFNNVEVGTVKKGYEKYFEKIDDKNYQIIKKLRDKIVFKRQDLLTDRFEKDYNLILCRNVVIYFTDEAKNTLYKKFYDSLANHGILFVGSTERILNYKDIGYNLKTHFFYEKNV
ncbi:MAG: protein-glutamate O-methyltransferase CheR [Vampirovibrionia bacterium]